MSGPPYGKTDATISIPDQDAVVLIGVLAVIDGALISGTHPEYQFTRIRERLAWEHLVAEDADQVQVGHALEAMIQRIRYARGE